MKIGSHLKKAREAKRLSQQEVADLLSISQKTLSNIESDKSNPSVYQLAMMGELYELNIIELLSQHGITFQVPQVGREKAAIDDLHYLREIRDLFEQLLKEKDSRIALLEEALKRLKKKIPLR
jgi:transcriptional regulator with XRE-family HTH domain